MNLQTILLSAQDTTENISAGGFRGAYPVGMFEWCMFFAFMGFLFIFAVDVMTRDVNSPKTPVKFSWVVLIEKNWARVVVNIIALYVAVRFFPEINGKPLSEHGAFVAGIGLDGVIVLLKKLRKAKR